MNGSSLEPRLRDELSAAVERGPTSGELMTQSAISHQLGLFRDRFGPSALQDADGEALLKLMHGREDGEARCLMYWLEFKDDQDFAGHSFGRIGGGSAFKFGIYQRQADQEWVVGPPKNARVVKVEEAIAVARQQREELVAGHNVLAAMDASDTSDAAYARLQAAMQKAAPKLSEFTWAHKYWFLLHDDRLDDYHSPRHQRYHLFKLLQMPADKAGVLDDNAPRFVCAGRFVAAAQELGSPIATLTKVLTQRDGGIRRYWRVGTTSGEAGGAGDSQWPTMRKGPFVSIGWAESVPDLSGMIGERAARTQIQEWLAPAHPNPTVASRKAGEILNFLQEMAEEDLVLACEGQDVLGVGRVTGPYQYDRTLKFPHKRPVEWLLLERWRMPETEGLRTTVFEVGRSAANLLELETRLFNRSSKPDRPPGNKEPESLRALDPLAARVESILRRKGQVVFYGPPGTGKTYLARRVARELAARQAFRKNFESLSEPEQAEIESPADATAGGLVRFCTFHPGYGYEDFIEGLRPKTVGTQMVFEPQDGIFKRLCADAARQEGRHFFLVIDEINRGDVPRIFGELITVIELDKREMPITLPVTGKSFDVPANVFLIGTMNTADRSISLLDAALRRRFGFIELMPDSSRLAGRRAGDLALGPWLDALNKRLRQHLKRDARNLQVGHAYLMPKPSITSVADFARVLRDEIIPLLEEYCYDDFDTLKAILGELLVDSENKRIREEIFAASREESFVQAVSYEEMEEPLVLTEEKHEDTAVADQAVDEDDENASGATT
jgi:5-methylcytosine-specific restriction protein B